MITVQQVPLQYIHQTWPLIEDYINSALVTEFDGEALYDLNNIRGYVASGEWMLCVGVDENNNIQGAATIAFNNYPLHRVAFVTTVGGRLVCNKDTVEQIKNIAKANGATVLQALGRPSIVRLWRKHNFTPLNTIVEMKL